MSDMSTEYKKIINEIENKISNVEEREFVKEKLSELSFSFMEIIDRLTKITDMRIKQIENEQENISKRIENVQSIIDNIESDIYEDDESNEEYEFEVICPYCNNEFSVDSVLAQKDEIECPECHNIIELDWNDEEAISCGGSCLQCTENCLNEEKEKYDKKDKKDSNQEDNEDDM